MRTSTRMDKNWDENWKQDGEKKLEVQPRCFLQQQVSSRENKEEDSGMIPGKVPR